MDLYREEVLDHYKSPHNFGELKDPTVVQDESNPLCGDRIFLQLKISGDKVAQIKFKGTGCAVSTAATSMMTDFFKGRNLGQLKELGGEDVLKIINMENISAGRLKCALLPLEALKHALTKLES